MTNETIADGYKGEEQMKDTEILPWQGNFKVTKHRNRTNGCDYCKGDVPTEGFIGFNGHALWICGNCFKQLEERGEK